MLNMHGDYAHILKGFFSTIDLGIGEIRFRKKLDFYRKVHEFLPR